MAEVHDLEILPNPSTATRVRKGEEMPKVTGERRRSTKVHVSENALDRAALQNAAYWLDEKHMLRLTALELGALMAVLGAAKNSGIGTFLVNVRGPNDEKIPMPMIDRLIEKAEASK